MPRCARHLSREVAAFGLGLTTLMQLVFLVTGFERGAVYLALVAVGAAAAALATWGALRLGRRDGPSLLSVGMALSGLARAALIVTGLSRLAPWLNWGLVVAYAWVAVWAALWAAGPAGGASRAAAARLGTYVLGAGFFVASMNALSGGRLSGLLGLALGSVGHLVAAPMLEPGAADPVAGPSPS